MTSSSFISKRHVPEEELHAYLDQALSRSQCVEIESHLALCPSCREARDEIAALRDRTTSLLAVLAPPVVHTPPVAEIRQRVRQRSNRRQRVVRRTAWAASILFAVATGWAGRQWLPEAEGGPSLAPSAPVVTVARSDSVGALDTGRDSANQSRDERPPAAPVDPAPVEHLAVAPESTTTAPAGTVTTADPPRFRASLMPSEAALKVSSASLPSGNELAGDGVWRSLSWAGAQKENANEWIPRVEGLPVVDVQIKQSTAKDQKPLMVVSQRLASGEVIRTVEGPSAEVSELLSRQSGQSVTAPFELVGDSATPQDPQPRAPNVGRILAIQGSISLDSLRTLLLRLR